ncbi:uncharacterized protein LOC143912781 [Arctopsyche grandis]|uniref:uncharacterized protein LOC143912781 n=1 Tax=Arctopsyche grandis TaxID=121162 RepID=UPI00406D99A9
MSEDGPDAVRLWLLSLGFPLDEAQLTDWDTLCRGRLPTFWRKMMTLIKSKQQINNIRRNILLKEIKQYKQRENSSATKLGFIRPPPQIYYPKEQEKLNKKLDTIQLTLKNKINECKLTNEEGKRKCFELQDAKQDALTIERQIYLMKKTIMKLNDDIQRYKDMSTSLKKFKNSFTVKELQEEIENDNFLKFIWDTSKKETDQSNMNDVLSNSEKSDFLTNSMLNITVAHNGNESHFTESMQTFQVNNLILNYHRNLPDVLEESVYGLLQEKLKKIKSSIRDGECTTYKMGLLRFNIVHAQIVVDTLQIKKDVEKAKTAAMLIKSKILHKLSGDCQRMDLFEQQCSQIRKIAYKESFFEELAQLKSLTGFYSKCHNDLHVNKIGYHENSSTALQFDKEKYFQDYFSCKDKIKSVFSLLEKMKLCNDKMSTDLTGFVTNKRPDKVLWYPENKDLQEIYTRVILKNPNTFKLENSHSFESLTYLRSVIAEYNLDQQLQQSSDLLTLEMEWFKSYGDRSCTCYHCKCIEKEESNDTKMNILLNFNHIVKKMKFKLILDNLDCHKYNSHTVENILGSCLECNLTKREEIMLSSAEKYIPKNITFTDLDQIFNDFNDTHDFFIEYLKCKDVVDETVR